MATTAIGQSYHPMKNNISFDLIHHSFLLKKKVVYLDIDQTVTTVRMAPKSFKYTKDHKALNNIVYPTGTKDKRPYETIARYRSAMKEPNNNFRRHPLSDDLEDTETVILGLDEFVRHFDGELVFTDQSISYADSINQAVQGIGNLGNSHLFAGNYIPTAVFDVVIDRHYERVLASSVKFMCEFILDFVKGIANALSCDEDSIRVFELKKMEKDPKQTRMKFGLTTQHIKITERLANNLQILIERGFQTESVLRWIQPAGYIVQWKTIMSFFQLQINDFDPDANIYYDHNHEAGSVACSGDQEQYHVPLGYVSHALNIEQKYSEDNQWYKNSNVSTEWNHAFYGIAANLTPEKIKTGTYTRCLRSDLMKEEATEQKKEADERPGLYVVTQCDTGLYPDQTIQFTIPTTSRKIHFAFHCRVKPNSYTRHRKSRNPSSIWRVYKVDAVRPYRILLKYHVESRASTSTA